MRWTGRLVAAVNAKVSRTSGDGQRTTLNAIPGEYRRGSRGPVGSSEERFARVRKSARRTNL